MDDEEFVKACLRVRAWMDGFDAEVRRRLVEEERVRRQRLFEVREKW